MNILNKLKSTKPEDVFPHYIEFITTNEIELKIMNLHNSFYIPHKVAMVIFVLFILIQVPVVLGLSVFWTSFSPALIILVSVPYILFNTSLIPYMKRREITEFKWFLFKRKVNRVKFSIDNNFEGVTQWLNMMLWIEDNVEEDDYSIYTKGLGTNVASTNIVHHYVFKNKEDAITFKLEFGGK